MHRVIEPFAVFRKGQPLVFGAGDEVLDDNPILKTHPAHFEPAEDRVKRQHTSQGAVEQATAAPGEPRQLSTPPRKRTPRKRAASRAKQQAPAAKVEPEKPAAKVEPEKPAADSAKKD